MFLVGALIICLWIVFESPLAAQWKRFLCAAKIIELPSDDPGEENLIPPQPTIKKAAYTFVLKRMRIIVRAMLAMKGTLSRSRVQVERHQALRIGAGSDLEAATQPQASSGFDTRDTLENKGVTQDGSSLQKTIKKGPNNEIPMVEITEITEK